MRQMESLETFVSYQLFLARLKLAGGDDAAASAVLDEAEAFVREHNFLFRMADVAAAQVLTLLRQGKLAWAAQLAESHELPLSQARVQLALDEPSRALVLLEPLRWQAEEKGWADEQLEVMVLQALAHHADGDRESALQVLGEALLLAEPGGFIRLFVDEGPPMAQLLCEAAKHGIMPEYVGELLTVLEAEKPESEPRPFLPPDPAAQPLLEPLSERELEVLQLIAEGLANREIAERLFLAMSTVKGHNQNIFGKLQVQRRTEAVARARELGLL
jgi:LuxR family maltose regulon positive regulatory protein